MAATAFVGIDVSKDTTPFKVVRPSRRGRIK